MAILDRFRAQPRQKHADPAVRLGFVADVPIDERDLLFEIAREDADVRVRRAATSKLMDPAALAQIAGGDADESVRAAALAMLRDIALDAFEGVTEEESLAAVDSLTDARTLGAVAKTALREAVAARALDRVRDVRVLGSIARHAPLEPIRLAALSRLTDRAELLNVALNSEFKDTAVAAVDALGPPSDRETLDQIAARARNKGASKRARGVLREIDERAAAAAAALAAEAAAAAAEDAAVVEAAAITDSPVEEQLEEAADVAVEQAEAAEARVLADERARREAEEAEASAERRRLQHEADERARREAAERRAAAEAKDAATRRDALGRLQQLIVRLEPLAARADLTLKAGERGLRDLRAALADIPPLPSRRDYEEVVQRLNAVQTALAPKVLELREAAEWRQFANLGLQEQLCVRMEALRAVENPEEAATAVRALQEQWREVADVPRAQGEALWRRFKTAHDEVWKRCEAHFAEQARARGENLAKKTALCERAEALAESTNWIQTAEAIKALQNEWKTIGLVTRGQEKAVWERFRTACDRFFTRRHADLSDRKRVWAENLAKKEALCARVEALADSTEWETSAATIRQLQTEWKTIGPVKKTRSDAIWQRFRAAGDAFFARYAQRHEIARGERVVAREAICTEMEDVVSRESLVDSRESLVDSPESIVDSPAPEGLLDTVRQLRRRWEQEISARGVDRERAAALDLRFAAAFDAVLTRWPAAFAHTDLDPDANRKRLEALVKKMEDLAAATGPAGAKADEALSPTNRMAAMLKEALAANTIGGKVDDGARLRAAAEEVRQAQASWSRVGPVAENLRRPLQDRFQRAIRRITDQAAGTRSTARS